MRTGSVAVDGEVMTLLEEYQEGCKRDGWGGRGGGVRCVPSTLLDFRFSLLQ